ncbi:MAG: site-specific integrase [Clostridia bacterium]|nr:site-specific integrase [Clostridia bacterium]
MVDLKVTTLTRYKKSIETILKPNLGLYRLKSLTRELLQKFLVEMYDNGYSQNSLISIKALLTKSMNYAVDNHYIICSPAVRLKTPRNRIPQIPTRSAPHHFIKPDIMHKVFDRFPERTSSFIPLKIAYECGLRLGETFALCWEDIDLDNKIIYINRQVQWLADKELGKDNNSKCGNGYWYFCAPKYNSYRVIEISDELGEILSRERYRQDRAKVYYDELYQKYFVSNELSFSGRVPLSAISINRIKKYESGFPVHFVCVREDGSYITPRTMQHASMIIKKEIFKDFDFHSLRHTHATMLAEIGVDQKYIQTRLGHSNICTTFEVYEHTTEIMRNRGRSALNAMFKL